MFIFVKVRLEVDGVVIDWRVGKLKVDIIDCMFLGSDESWDDYTALLEDAQLVIQIGQKSFSFDTNDNLLLPAL